MFNFGSALAPWNGQSFELQQLQRSLSDLRLRHMGQLPPEIGVRELLELGVEQGWIVEQQSGRLLITAPECAAV